MISSTEQTQIRDYLIYKKLPIDILLEVQDHFENQIESLERENNISFQEAFLLAKMSWEKDFKLVRKSPFFVQSCSENCKRDSKRGYLEIDY